MGRFGTKEIKRTKSMDKIKITLKTMYGLEPALMQELSELGYPKAEQLNRAVRIEGTWSDVYFLNMYIRTGLNILVELTSFTFDSKESLYKNVSKIDWPSYFDVSKTFAVKGAVHTDVFPHSQLPLLIVKDAIVDTFRNKLGERPNVELKKPQIMIDAHLSNKTCTISINTSGAPLYQRGYRTETGEAPLNEVVAAGLLFLSGWDRKSALIDPFCGSGTIPIEAALLASGIPPNIERHHFAFKNLVNFDKAAWEKIVEDAPKRPVKLDFPIFASDADQLMVTKAKRNIRALPVSRNVQFQIEDFEKVQLPEGKATLICNPPYGERMGDEIEALYQRMGDWFKTKLAGYECWVISSNEDALKNIGLKPSRKIKLFNGSLECSFRNYSMYEGSKKG